ncbi:MAG TPA: DUF6515 family protein [Steroidobacteraceae bacterium]|jgi:hypothetical protein|nr:DUF6515 family protein [Steroidobacteraceae bacterium]
MNTASKLKLVLISGLLILGLAGPAANFAAQAHFDRGPREVFDNRYSHGRYYLPRGAVVHALPPGYRAFYYGGRPFFFVDGVWYAPGPGGFVVTLPPVGLVVSVLPPFATTVWLGGVPYYYANDVYYLWRPDLNAYVVVAPPASADQPGSPPPSPSPSSASPAENFFIYPKNGQSQAQEAQDRYECHSWATSQTGFDPTRPGGGVPPAQNATKGDQYRRAMSACLEARGYTVG